MEISTPTHGERIVGSVAAGQVEKESKRDDRTYGPR